MALQQQLQVRNVFIQNHSNVTILARVSYSKSAISRSNLKGFSRMVSTNSKSNAMGGGIQAAVPGFGDIGFSFNAAKSKENKSDNTHYNEQEIELIVSQFDDEGWTSIKSEKERSFAVQGQIAYISVMDFSNGHLAVHNWNTMGNQFVYDGEDFEEIKNYNNGNGERDNMQQITPGAVGAAASLEITTNVNTEIENVNVAEGDTDESEWKNIASWVYPCCSTSQSMITVYNALYFVFGTGLVFLMISLFHMILKYMFWVLISPCNIPKMSEKQMVIMSCEAAPFSFKYRKYKDDEEQSTIRFKTCAYFIWFGIDLPIILMHLFTALIMCFSVVCFPFALIHLELAMIRLCPFLYQIKKC